MTGRFLLVGLFSLGLASPPTFAQEGGAILGTVKDASGASLPGASVTALNTGSGRESAAVTDAAGKYEVKGLASGSYRVTARLSGFSQAGRTVTVTGPEPVTVDFSLGLGALSEAITVTAAKGERATAEIPQVVTIVTAEQIEDRRPQGVQEAFERAPNLRAVDTNPYRQRPQFRGFSNSRVLLVVDGERLNNGRYDVAASGVTPSTIDVTQIQSIEVVGGAASSLYGSDAIAGTINIITRTADRPATGRSLDTRANFDFNTNSQFVRGNLAATYATQKLALRGSFSAFDQPNYKQGGTAISRADVTSLGNFVTDAGNVLGRAIATTYVNFELPAGAEVPNGKAHGNTYTLDGSFFPTDTQLLRLKYSGNRFKDLGLPFSIPPFDVFERVSSFSNFDKASGRYEVKEVASWLPRIALSGYQQRLKRPQDDINSTIVLGSSYRTVGTLNQLTGSASSFVLANRVATLNDIKSTGGDLQFNVLPWRNAQFTAGASFVTDKSVDTFGRVTYSPTGAVLTSVQDAKTTPDTTYKNKGAYGQLEWTLGRRVRLSAGARVDNWKTEAGPSKGFPAGNEFSVIQIALPQIIANPGSLVVAGIQGIDQVAAGTGKLSTNTTSTTGNAGVTFLLPGGINPYLRWASSFREPEITVRYLVRNFGSPVISIPSLPNTTVQPEKGKNIDVGVKIDRSRVKAQIGYFENRLTNAVSNVFSPNYCIPTNPAAGILLSPFPPCVLTGRHQVQFFQRVNIPGETKVKGYEAQGEVSIPIGNRGSLNPYLSLGWLHGTVGTPNATQLAAIERFYNRSDLPVLLEGSPNDVPFGELPSFSGTAALKYADAGGKWWAEWEWRFTSRITRVDPDTAYSLNTTQYGYLKSLEGYNKHSIRAGYNVTGKTPFKLTLGIENILNTTYFLPFQNSPSPGRAVVLGATVNWKKLF